MSSRARLDESLERIRAEFERGLSEARGNPSPAEALSSLRTCFLGRKAGRLTLALKAVRDLPAEDRPGAGEAANLLRAFIEEALAEAERGAASKEQAVRAGEGLDVSLPGAPHRAGSLHPVTLVRLEIEEIFLRMGFAIEEGPEIETDWHNFEALNIPPDHPARDMQDTFYVEGGGLLRTHTSPIQIRTMQGRKPPLKVIALGKVFRRDSDVSHSPMFHQVEGLVVGPNVSMADLKGTVREFCRAMFRPDTRVRLRPGYFPFVEPGAEFDISCILCGGSGCKTCKRTGWIEMGGSGMVHPNVFRMVGYDPEEVTGFAFGFGVDRIAMLRYAIDDIRLLFEGDLRFLDQFRGER